MKKKILIILGIVVLIGGLIFGLYEYKKKISLHSLREIKKEVNKFSFNYSFVKKEGGVVVVDGYNENEANWYFHDNDLDFEFLVKSTRSKEGDYGRQLYVAYWESYFEKVEEKIDDDIKSYFQDTFKDIVNITDVSYINPAGNQNVWFINLNGKISDEAALSQLDSADIYRGLCDGIVKYDPKFKKRKKVSDTWYDSDDTLKIQLRTDFMRIGSYDIENDEYVNPS